MVEVAAMLTGGSVRSWWSQPSGLGVSDSGQLWHLTDIADSTILSGSARHPLQPETGVDGQWPAGYNGLLGAKVCRAFIRVPLALHDN
jgi:hypothetical protein